MISIPILKGGKIIFFSTETPESKKGEEMLKNLLLKEGVYDPSVKEYLIIFNKEDSLKVLNEENKENPRSAAVLEKKLRELGDKKRGGLALLLTVVGNYQTTLENYFSANVDEDKNFLTEATIAVLVSRIKEFNPGVIKSIKISDLSVKKILK